MNKVLKELMIWAIDLLIVLGLVFLLITFVAQRTVVDGESMEATLQNGDNLIVDKISYRFHEPERFDIVVFPFHNPNKPQDRTYFIKRIIGLPGESVSIDENGVIYIDGEVLEEGYGREIIRADKLGTVTYPLVLGEDEYFVLGDNRNNSTDSRWIGSIERGDIIGRAWFRMWPFSSIGFIKHS